MKAKEQKLAYNLFPDTIKLAKSQMLNLCIYNPIFP